MVAEEFIGDGKTLQRAWRQAYRDLEHRQLKNKLSEISGFFRLPDSKRGEREKENTDLNFPSQVKDLADKFTSLQNDRHEADYNPHKKFSALEAVLSIQSAETCIKHLRSLEPKHKRALAAYIGFRDR